MSEYYETDSGLMIPEHVAVDMKLDGARLTGVDLFCGCGGFSLGVMQAGFQILAAVDNEPMAAITYTMNLGKHPMQFIFVEDSDRKALEKALTKKYRHEPKQRDALEEFSTTGSGWISSHPKVPGVGSFFLGDITKISGRNILDAIGLEVGELDLVCGSPPCQGFSRANSKQGPNDPRNELVWEFARLVCEMRPKTMMLENVPEFATMTTPEGLLVIDVFTRILEDGGFAGANAMRAAMKHQKGVTLMRSKADRKKTRSKNAHKIRSRQPRRDPVHDDDHAESKGLESAAESAG